MIDDATVRRTSALLLGLVAFDLALVTLAFGLPDLWFAIFHGVERVDPQGFLQRCGANWAAFALLQAIAWRRWRAEPHWLVLVAGVRLSDMFTDWTYLAFSRDMTWFGAAALLGSSPANLLIGLHLLRTWRRVEDGKA
jgi:hypothetical protein